MLPGTRRRLNTALGVIALVALTTTAGLWLGSRLQPVSDLDLYALVLPDSTGQPRSLSEWRGRPLLINFWATWCAPCVREMPDLNRVRSELSERDLEVLGIALDRPDAVVKFLRDVPVDYPILLDDGRVAGVLSRLGNSSGSLPFTVLVDRNGRVRERHLGALPHQELRELAMQLL